MLCFDRYALRFVASLLIGLGAVLAACSSSEEPTPIGMSLEKIGGFEGAVLGAAEITAFDAASKRLFVVNGANGTVDVLDLSQPTAPKLVATINVGSMGAGVNSVAVHEGLVALAIEANPKTSAGKVAFYQASDLKLLHTVTVGALPDMLAFTPDGQYVVVANEGEPNSYGLADSVDPEGSVSIIKVNRGATPTVATADFKAYIGKEDELRKAGVRLYGPGANAAQDIEPEYVAISEDGKTAFVTLQENNAIAIVDIVSAKVTAIKALGYKDHSLAGMGLDASDEDGGTNTNSGTAAIKILQRPVRGLYLPDGIASFSVNGQTYLVTANEGDARADWPGFNEETRVRAHCDKGLDPSVFSDAANLIFDSNLGRLRITSTPNGGTTGKNAAGLCTELYAFGARSFSIWDSNLNRVYDSGDQFEQRTIALPNVLFNASNDNNTLDARSPNKGPEPEGIVVGRFGSKQFAFIGLERVGGVMVYDITDPKAAKFVTYYNTRNGAVGDRGPEGILLIPAYASPNGKPLLVLGNETSGSTAILQINLQY
ncbi:MAG: alkaline phosphatase [Burkholderiaceae bacterium]|nr:alkaline phosphatase [Burkholderiaceae bacterium]